MRRSSIRIRWVVVLVVFGGACNQPAETTAGLNEADKSAIDSVFEKAAAALRAADWDAFTAMFADDVVFHPMNSPALYGRDDLRKWVAAGPKPAAAFDFTNVEVVGEGNLAYATSDVAMNFEGVPADQGKQLVVLRKEPSGEWKTVAVSFNSNTPMPASASTAQ